MDDNRKNEISSVVRLGINRSVLSLAIKLSTAGLTYLMLVVLARCMSEVEYGLFAVGFSLATILAIASGMGQQTAILRFWPEHEVKSDQHGAKAALGAGWALTLGTSLAITLLLLLLTWIYASVTTTEIDSLLHIFAAALLIIPMAAAEYGSAALRSQGSVLTSMLPRDLVWRALVPLITFYIFVLGYDLSGVQALLITAFILAGLMIAQFLLGRKLGYYNAVSFNSVRNYWRARGNSSRWFFLGTVADSVALNIDIVFVGFFITAQSAGLYFNASRTAGLMTLFLFAASRVVAPMLARHYHANELMKARAMISYCTWTGFLFSLFVFALYIFFGEGILSLFGEEFTEGKIILLVISLGLLVDAATGPTRIVFTMTGHERTYVRIFGQIILLGLCIQLVVIPTFGLLAAAIVTAITRAASQIALVLWARHFIGIDPSIIGMLMVRKIVRDTPN